MYIYIHKYSLPMYMYIYIYIYIRCLRTMQAPPHLSAQVCRSLLLSHVQKNPWKSKKIPW